MSGEGGGGAACGCVQHKEGNVLWGQVCAAGEAAQHSGQGDEWHGVMLSAAFVTRFRARLESMRVLPKQPIHIWG